MSGYAVRNDGQGWRSVAVISDILQDEWYTEDTPPDPVALPLTTQELVVLETGKRDQLLLMAANRMGPLQDAVELDEATIEETAMLKKWKQYRIALNRIEQQPTFPLDIVWPASPE